jgi:ABC-type dipeptide/oligopeptide/nickel transport system permease component
MGTTLIFAVLLIISNTIVDIVYLILDPRMQVS